MKVKFVLLATTLFVATGVATAQSRVEGSSSKTDVQGVTIRTTGAAAAADLNVSLSRTPVRVNAAVGGSDVLIGNITACDGGVISNSHTNVRARDLTIRSTGSAKIGNISAGC